MYIQKALLSFTDVTVTLCAVAVLMFILDVQMQIAQMVSCFVRNYVVNDNEASNRVYSWRRHYVSTEDALS